MSPRVLPPNYGGTAAPPAGRAPALAEGAELAGPPAGPGHREPRGLVYRADGRVVSLPPLLYRIAQILDGLAAAPIGGGAPAARGTRLPRLALLSRGARLPREEPRVLVPGEVLPHVA